MRRRSLVTNRWAWVVVGVILLIVGVVMYAGGHVVKPTEVHGTINEIDDFTQNGAYDHSEIKLNETNTVYSFNKDNLQPKWPSQYVKDGKVDIWVDEGTTNAIAIQVYDQTDSNPVKYTTDLYDHPELGVSNAHNAGIGFGVISLPFLLLGLLWPIFPWGKKKQQRQPAPVMAGQQAPMSMQPGFPPQQGGYPSQPGFPQQPGYPPQQGGYPPQQSGYPPQGGYPPQQPGPDNWGQPPRQ